MKLKCIKKANVKSMIELLKLVLVSFFFFFLIKYIVHLGGSSTSQVKRALNHVGNDVSQRYPDGGL